MTQIFEKAKAEEEFVGIMGQWSGERSNLRTPKNHGVSDHLILLQLSHWCKAEKPQSLLYTIIRYAQS